jgi:hypothetical protein
MPETGIFLPVEHVGDHVKLGFGSSYLLCGRWLRSRTKHPRHDDNGSQLTVAAEGLMKVRSRILVRFVVAQVLTGGLVVVCR